MILRRTEARTASRAAHRAAFTLLEVMVVAAIILILASAATFGVMRYLEDAKEQAALMGVTKLEQAASAFKLSPNHGDWPGSLAELCLAEEGKPAYLEEKDLRDPWGQPYVYDPATRHPATAKPRIYSTGGGNKIIANWN